MPIRSLVEQLPADIKDWLDKALIGGSFANYEKLAEALEEKGYGISKSSLHRYGQKFEDKLSALKIATEQSKAIVEVVGDDQGAQTEALLRLVQEKFFGILVDCNTELKNLPKIGHAIADIARASVNQKKWMAEVREKTKRAAQEVAKVAKKGGLTDETISRIEAEILGIAR